LFSLPAWKYHRTGSSGRRKFVCLALLISGTVLPISWLLNKQKMKSCAQPLEPATATSSKSQPSSSLCQLCQSTSLGEICGPNHDRMQAHQPSYLALKKSASDGCQLCAFIWRALGRSRDPVPVDGKVTEVRSLLEHVSEKYPGRQISLVAWGRGSHLERWVDRIWITTTGEIPDVESDEEDLADPTMHPDYQFALSNGLDIFAYPGKVFCLFQLPRSFVVYAC